MEYEPIPFSSSIWCVHAKSLVVTFSFETPWTVAHLAPLSMGFPRQECWLPFPIPGDLPDPGIKPTSPVLVGRFFTIEPQGSLRVCVDIYKIR